MKKLTSGLCDFVVLAIVDKAYQIFEHVDDVVQQEDVQLLQQLVESDVLPYESREFREDFLGGQHEETQLLHLL